MTEPQRKALEFLATVKFATPADIGEAMGGTRTMRAQGLGRLGGRMAKTLMDKGWAVGMSWYHDGFPAYGITAKGRNALDDRNAKS